MGDSNVLFMMNIIDGYSFRNVMSIVNSETDRVHMVVSPEKIEMSFMNRARCATHSVIIDAREIQVDYNIYDEDGDLYEQYPIAFDTRQMLNATKGIGKRDGLMIYWMNEQPNLCVQHVKSGSRDPGKAGANFVPIINHEYINYEIPDGYPEEPNVRVIAKDFSEQCTQCSSMKCISMQIVGKATSMVTRSLLSNNQQAGVMTWGKPAPRVNNGKKPLASNIDDFLKNINSNDISAEQVPSVRLVVKPLDELANMKVPISTVKSISKIHNISPPGTLLRFYFANNRPIKIESAIGGYGKYIICLRDSSSVI